MSFFIKKCPYCTGKIGTFWVLYILRICTSGRGRERKVHNFSIVISIITDGPNQYTIMNRHKVRDIPYLVNPFLTEVLGQ